MSSRRSYSADSNRSWISMSGLDTALLFMDRSVFRFLDLPPELRLMIIYLALRDYSAIDRIIGKHVQNVIMDAGKPLMAFKPPKVIKTTPTILLLCQQIYREAMPVLKRETLTLSHGLMDFGLMRLINPFTVRNLTSIVLTHDGHNILDKRLRISFLGHQRLVAGLAGALKEHGHSLEYLELHFTSPHLQWHVENCWVANHACDMKRWLTEIVNTWVQVRGIRKVEIIGWLPEHMKARMLRLMQSNYNPFLFLPTSIVKRIVAYTTSLSSISTAINCANVYPTQDLIDLGGPVRSTPPLLLIDHFFHKIFFGTLYNQPLVLDLVGRPANPTVLHIRHFLSRGTALAIKNVTIRIRHRAWLHLVEDLAYSMMHARLDSFHLHLDDDRRVPPSGPTASGLKRVYPDHQLCLMLNGLRYLGDVGRVTFSGDLARPSGGSRFLRDLKKAMEGPVDIQLLRSQLASPARMRIIQGA